MLIQVESNINYDYLRYLATLIQYISLTAEPWMVIVALLLKTARPCLQCITSAVAHSR